MAATILLFLLIVALCLFFLYALIKRIQLRKTKNLVFICINLLLILLLVVFTGTGKIRSAIATVIHRSAPKQPMEVYGLLFKKPMDGCVKFIHFKDQLIPKIDCCIWMELTLCPAELNRITRRKKYIETTFTKADSLIFLKPFSARPEWWNPQMFDDGIVQLHLQFNPGNEQTLFFSKDSSHIFICDQAL
ncbi:MAG: hypothetical protein IPP72_02820 [Chitinophagaceae bacterium]|nr:hypothetical protein [Chitinophagaceae bacterium]